MFKFVLTSMLLAEATALLNLPAYNNRIMGGKDVIIEEFPYQISLQKGGSHYCGGSIISKKFVITAAYCTSNISTAEVLTVRAGSSFRETGGQVIPVKKIHQHPEYGSGTNFSFDITILELSVPLNYTYGIISINLPDSGYESKVGEQCIVSGWGAVEEGGSYSNQLQAIYIQVVDTAECESRITEKSITKQMFCALTPNGGQGTCQADSGGPFVCNGKVVGITSWGLGCARPNNPSVYTSVGSVRDFIKKITNI